MSSGEDELAAVTRERDDARELARSALALMSEEQLRALHAQLTGEQGDDAGAAGEPDAAPPCARTG